MLKVEALRGNIANIECVGTSYRKNFTIFNFSPFSVDENVSLLLETTNPDAFKLYPVSPGMTVSTPGGGINTWNYWQIDVTILANQYFTFSVDCVNAKETDEAILYSTTSTIETADGKILFDYGKHLSFTVVNPESSTKREIGSLLAVDENSLQVATSIERKFTKDSSFGIARTNPKLTGNVKITVDSTENIWLNSIDATKDLSDEKFKKYRISPNSSYAIDIKNFFDAGTTPPELVFSLYQADTQYTSSKRTLSEQYDRFYQYGVEALASKFYDEDFSFFAPLYLKNDIPDYFVIFRTNGPINSFSYETPMSEWPEHIINDVLSKSSIIKTYSLKEDSPVGKYLRNIVNHPARKPSDMTVSFQVDGYTSFNGISYREGSFAQKGELLYDYYQQENPIMSVEEFLTLGFERNSIISSSIINLEFLFDDPEVDQYSINRYFGLYVNSIELAKFELDENGFVQFSKQIGQTPIPRKGVDATKTSLAPFVQNNDDGIRLYINANSIQTGVEPGIFTSSAVFDGATGATFTLYLPGNISNKLEDGESCTIFAGNGASGSCELLSSFYSDDVTHAIFSTGTFTGSFPLISTSGLNFYTEEKFNNFKLNCFENLFVENSGRLFYLKDREDFLHSVKSTDTVYASVDAFNVEKMIEVTLHDKSVDITKFTGFLDIVTQTPATLLNKGKSSLCVKINTFFEANDYIEIKWENGPTVSGYPLRWRVIANTTSLLPGESWPAYGINSDPDGEYYFTYFHPGDSTINLDVFVKSIQDAFNRFPFKNFEILAKNTSLYFKSTEIGLSSEKASLIFFNDNPSISVMGITAPASGSVNFIGASDRNKTRAKINKTVANGMLVDEYVSTEGNFSKAKQYRIFNEVIISAPYLDEPVYDETGERLLDFTGSEYYHTIVLENESQPIQLTYDKKLTSYELFRPSFGIFSILPFKDFDTDFHASDYAKSYTPELIEYFGREYPPFTVSLTGSHYVFEEGITFSSYPQTMPFLSLSDGNVPSTLFTTSQFKFEALGGTAIIVGPSIILASSGLKVLLLPDKKSLYYNENDPTCELSKFKGFLSLSSIVTSSNEAQFQIYENLWDPKRFVFQNIDSEYDRLAENFLKTLCLKSRVVPYCLKWVYDGKDIRENDYRLNLNRAFGVMNFSPSLQGSSDPKYHTHEWPYLDSVPDTFPVEDYPQDAYSYMFEPLSDKYDFSSTTIDWFTQYFSTGFPNEQVIIGGTATSVKLDNAEKYSIFKYEDFTERTFTMFRGQKLEIIDKKNPQKYDGYKFSAVIKTESIDYLINEDPISFNTIVNEKWKFIVLVITVKVSSYRYPNGRMSYTDLYTLDNSNYVATFYDLIPGYPSYKLNLPNDYKLSDPLNLSFLSAEGLYIFDTYLTSDKFLEDLQEEIIEVDSGVMNRLCASAELSLGIDVSVSLPKPVSNSVGSTFVKLQDVSGIVSGNIKYGFLVPTDAGVATFPNSFIDWSKFVFYHESGGNNAYSGLRDRLSFFQISNVLTGSSERKSIMDYDIYDSLGNHSDSPDFSFSIISPETLTRTDDFFPISDTDKPPTLLTYTDIGAVLESTKNLQTLYRYQGNFSPKFRDVLKFWVRESEDYTLAIAKDFLFCNTHFATEINNFSILKNQYYNKVADSEILSISANSGYLPVYPLVKEISIDKKDVFAWSSNWDDSYYRKYSDIDTYLEVRGTDSMKEIKSLFGSKCMRVPKSFDLYKLTTEQLPEGTDLSLSTKEFAYIDLETKCLIRIDIYDRLLREMMGTTVDLKAKTEFLRTISIIPDSFTPAEIDEKVREYLIQNIMPLYEIQNVKLYVLQTGNSDTDQISTTTTATTRPIVETTIDPINGEVSLDENILFLKNYITKKDAKLTNVGNMIFQIDYPLDSRYWTSLSLGVSVKRI